MNKFRFAIMGAGNISERFATAVSLLEDAEVVAIASQSMERAKAFAKSRGIQGVYDDYRQMLEKVQPDCVYIGVTTNAHYKLSLLCIENKVPVICEKSMFTNSKDAIDLFTKAKEAKIFAMEAMWSRFLPAVNKAKEWLERGCIGVPSMVDADLGFQPESDPKNRFFNPELGGGASFDLTVYAYEITTYLLNQKIKETQVDALWSSQGVDTANTVLLHFDKTLAVFKTTLISWIEERMVIYGDQGRIVLPRPHVTMEAFLYDKDNLLIEHFLDSETQEGFIYEAAEAKACIEAGKLESERVPHKDTIACTKLFDQLYKRRP